MSNDWFASDLLSHLWEISWQSAVIAALVLSLRLALGRTLGSRWRHALWVLVLCRLLMPVLPQSRISLFSLTHFVHPVRPEFIAADNESPPVPAPAASTHISIKYGAVDLKLPPQNNAESQPIVPIFRRPLVWMGVWLAVSASLILRLVFVNLRFHRALDRIEANVNPRLVSLLDNCCQQIGISFVSQKSRPHLIITDLVDAPAVCGVLRPKLLLPTILADRLSDAQVRLIFLHELAHIKCRDITLDWVWTVMQSLHWFNPSLWLIGPMRRNDRELARDEMVLSLTGPDQVERYGRTLLELAQPVRLPLFCPGLLGMFSGPRHLQRRIKMVAQFKSRRMGSGWIGVAVMIAAAGCALTSPRHDSPPATAPVMTAAAATSPSLVDQRQFLAATTTQYTEDLNDPDLPSATDAATLAKLDKPLPELRFNGNSLKDVLDYLRDTSGLNIYVDWHALQRGGIAKDAPVTARLKDIKLSKALELIFKSVEGDDDDHRLGYMVGEGVVIISTRAELNKNVDTRRYDLNDLLFIPPDYSNVPDLTQKNTPQKQTSQDGESQKLSPSAIEDRASRIDEIKQYIIDNVEPDSWKEKGGKVGSISVNTAKAVMLITQTPENQRKICAALESLRASHGLQLSLETRFLILDDSDEAQLPTAIQQRLATVHGAGRFRTDQFLSQEEVTSLIRSRGQSKSGVILACPRLTLFNGQTAVIVLETQQAYVAGIKVVPSSSHSGKPTYQPQTDTTPAEAITEKVTVCAAPDRASVFVDLHFQSARLLALLPEHWTGAPPDVDASIQRPLTSFVKLDRACAIPDMGTLLLACPLEDRPAGPSSTQPSINDQKIADLVEQDHHRRAYLLIKPTILGTSNAPQRNAEKVIPRD